MHRSTEKIRKQEEEQQQHKQFLSLLPQIRITGVEKVRFWIISDTIWTTLHFISTIIA